LLLSVKVFTYVVILFLDLSYLPLLSETTDKGDTLFSGIEILGGTL
jgi:hypothetical protein